MYATTETIFNGCAGTILPMFKGAIFNGYGGYYQRYGQANAFTIKSL